jgi:phosphatidylinositol-3-phosphatase
MTRTARPFTVAMVICLFLVGAIPAGEATTTSIEGVPHLGHVFVIVGENMTYSHIKPTNSPYLLGTLRPDSAWFTNYYAATHWSQANYVALTSGQFNKCQQQDYGAACHQNVPNLFKQIDMAGGTWKTWLEGGAARCDFGGHICEPQGPCPLTGFYTTGNPAINYDNIEGKYGVFSFTDKSDECLANDIYAGGIEGNPMEVFDSMLAAGTDVPDFNLVIPNGCEDGIGNCQPINNRYTQFDEFLRREVPNIEASPAWTADSVIVVVDDEDERAGGMAKKNGLGQGGHTICAIISPLVVNGDYDTKTYSYSLLRTLQDGYGLAGFGYLGNANAVDPMNTIWRDGS